MWCADRQSVLGNPQKGIIIQVMRINVVGLPASGKSTFASAISKKLSIPHIHLDRFWFESGGRQGAHTALNLGDIRAQVRKKVEEAIQADDWVSDGTYLHVQDLLAPRSDVIVFLDLSLWQRLLRHAQRTFFERGRHKEVSFWDDIAFFREIIRRTYSSGPKLRRFVAEHPGKTVILHSRKEAENYIRNNLREQ